MRASKADIEIPLNKLMHRTWSTHFFTSPSPIKMALGAPIICSLIASPWNSIHALYHQVSAEACNEFWNKSPRRELDFSMEPFFLDRSFQKPLSKEEVTWVGGKCHSEVLVPSAPSSADKMEAEVAMMSLLYVVHAVILVHVRCGSHKTDLK